jgi:hypothetical protein
MTDAAPTSATPTTPAATVSTIATPTSGSTTATIKPGISTTEHALMLIAMVLNFVMASDLITNIVWVKIATIALQTLGALGYGAVRTSLKVAAMKATVLMLLITAPALMLVSCLSSAQVKAGIASIEACGKNDAGPVITQLENALVSSNYNVEVAGVATAYNLTQDAVNCLVQMIAAVRSAGAGSGSAIATAAEDPVVAHAHAYLSAHKGSGS